MWQQPNRLLVYKLFVTRNIVSERFTITLSKGAEKGGWCRPVIRFGNFMWMCNEFGTCPL